MRKGRGGSLIEHLESKHGSNLEKLFDLLSEIAHGTLKYAEATGDGSLEKVTVPTVKERLEAARLLIAYGLGQPISRNQVAMEVRQATPKLDLDKLSFEELQEFDRLARKAEGLDARALPTGYAPPTVEGEFRETSEEETDDHDE